MERCKTALGDTCLSAVEVSPDSRNRSILAGRNENRHVLVQTCQCFLWVADADTAGAGAATRAVDDATAADAAGTAALYTTALTVDSKDKRLVCHGSKQCALPPLSTEPSMTLLQTQRLQDLLLSRKGNPW